MHILSITAANHKNCNQQKCIMFFLAKEEQKLRGSNRFVIQLQLCQYQIKSEKCFIIRFRKARICFILLVLFFNKFFVDDRFELETMQTLQRIRRMYPLQIYPTASTHRTQLNSNVIRLPWAEFKIHWIFSVQVHYSMWFSYVEQLEPHSYFVCDVCMCGLQNTQWTWATNQS